MGQKKYKRKKYLILIKFQIKYILYILLFLYLGALIAGYTVYWTTWVTLGEKLASVYPRGRLVYIFKHANMVLLWRLLLITPLFVFMGIRLSHRIAGPVYRLRIYLENLIQGDYSQRLRLRAKDELKDLATKIDQLCTSLKINQEQRIRVIDEIVTLLKENNLEKSTFDNIKNKLDDIKEK